MFDNGNMITSRGPVWNDDGFFISVNRSIGGQRKAFGC